MITDIVVRDAPPKGKGVFALRSFRKGEFIFRRRHDRVVSRRQEARLSADDRRHLTELELRAQRSAAAAGLLPQPLLRSERDAQRRQGVRVARHLQG